MSYDIVYDKQFIKIPQEGQKDKFIPMVLAGSSNCWMVNSFTRKDMRSRSWSPFSFVVNDKKMATEAELLEGVEAHRQKLIDRNEKTLEEFDGKWDKYEDKKFGYFSGLAINGSTRNTTFGQFKGIFKTGCQKALTVEQLTEANVNVVLYSYTYGMDGFSEEKKEAAYSRRTPKTTEELLRDLEVLGKLLKKHNLPLYIKISGWDGGRNLEEAGATFLRKKFFPQKKKETVNKEFHSGFAVELEDEKEEGISRYYHRLTKYGYQFTWEAKGAKQFLTKEKAQAAADRILKQRSSIKKTKVVPVQYQYGRYFKVPA